MEKLKVNNKDVLFIGDTNHDYEVATKLNVDCLLISHGHHSKARLLKTKTMVVSGLENIIN